MITPRIIPIREIVVSGDMRAKRLNAPPVNPMMRIGRENPVPFVVIPIPMRISDRMKRTAERRIPIIPGMKGEKKSIRRPISIHMRLVLRDNPVLTHNMCIQACCTGLF